MTDSAIDVSAEVAALRSGGGRRPWALTLLAAASILGLVALTAPRERTVALRWLREAYASRTQSAAQALLPLPVTEPPVVEPLLSSPGSDDTTGELLAARSTGDDGAVPTPPGSTEPTAGSAAPTELTPEEMKAEHPSSATTPGASDPNASVAPGAIVLAAQAAPQVARASVANGSRTRPLAATRKRSSRAASLAFGRTKARSTRQNSPRKDGGSGIIRQTPF